MLLELTYFVDEFKSDYALDSSDTEHVRTFEKFSTLAERFVLSLCGTFKYVEDNYTDDQKEALKMCVAIWVEHWLRNGYDLTPGGTRSVQSLGFNQSITNPQDPEFIPKQIRHTLITAGLTRSIIAVNAFGKSEGTTSFGKVDNDEWGF